MCSQNNGEAFTAWTEGGEVDGKLRKECIPTTESPVQVLPAIGADEVCRQGSDAQYPSPFIKFQQGGLILN